MPFVYWTSELRDAAATICTDHRSRDLESRAREIWHGAKVGEMLTPTQQSFVQAMRSRFGMARDTASTQAEDKFSHAWSDAYQAAERAAEDFRMTSPEQVAADISQAWRDAGLDDGDTLALQALPEPVEGAGDGLAMVDVTPTWRALLPALVAVLEHGSPEGRDVARQELRRMAAAADLYNQAGR